MLTLLSVLAAWPDRWPGSEAAAVNPASVGQQEIFAQRVSRDVRDPPRHCQNELDRRIKGFGGNHSLSLTITCTA